MNWSRYGTDFIAANDPDATTGFWGRGFKRSPGWDPWGHTRSPPAAQDTWVCVRSPQSGTADPAFRKAPCGLRSSASRDLRRQKRPDHRSKLIRLVIWQPMARIRDHLMAEVWIEPLQLPRRLDR